MSNIISDSVSKLSAITDQTPIDWDAFDSVLKGLEDINAYDEHDEETILSEFIMDGEFYKRGFILADVVRHFLACGYDVSANDGLNGGLALHSLCWSSYDHYVLEAAKVLMNGEERYISRKAALTGLLSDICDDLFSQTPIINLCKTQHNPAGE